MEDGYVAELSDDEGKYQVPAGCYFMLGDNRNHSIDSRFWINKFVEKDKILAKAIFIVYPLTNFGPLK